MNNNFESELAALLNKYSLEPLSCTPDFVLARYLGSCLNSYNEAVGARDRHRNLTLAMSPPLPFPASDPFDELHKEIEELRMKAAHARR